MATSGSPSTAPSPGGNSNAQAAPPVVVPLTHVTTLLDPQAVRSEQPIANTPAGKSPGEQSLEPGRGPLPQTGSAPLATTDAATAPLDPHAGGNPEELPLPHAAGLIADVLPFDRAALEQAVDQFFDRLEDLGVGQLMGQCPIRVVPLSLALLSTVTAVEMARRRLRFRAGGERATRGRNPRGSEELLGFPELPGSWSTRLI